jgi:uncharacterized membrane protein
MIPKSRLDSLTDGIFAFAMTLLVLGLNLPPSFQPKNDSDLIAALTNLDGQFLAYFISFFVLGLRWLGHVRHKREEPEKTSREYGLWILIHLFFVTCLPFSTMVVGQYGDLAAAVWLYAANMAAMALAAMRISFIAERDTGKHPEHSGRLELVALILSAVLSAVISLYSPGNAMFAYFLNAAVPVFRRWKARQGATSRGDIR